MSYSPYATIAKLEAKVSDLEGELKIAWEDDPIVPELRSRLEDVASLALANGLRADAAERRIAKAIDVLLNNDIARCVAEAVAVLRGE